MKHVYFFDTVMFIFKMTINYIFGRKFAATIIESALNRIIAEMQAQMIFVEFKMYVISTEVAIYLLWFVEIRSFFHFPFKKLC